MVINKNCTHSSKQPVEGKAHAVKNKEWYPGVDKKMRSAAT